MNQRYTPYDPKLGKSITTTGQAVLRKLIKQLGLKMNERIKELAEQAGVFAGDFAGAGIYSIHNKDEVEKFAELIVKECARVQHKRFCEHGDVSWDILMEHFGVEE
jgi:hypothetical protein